MKIKKVLGFTVSELIIVLTLLAILGTISFVSFTGYSSDARDSVRITDLKHIETGLETYYSESGSYPKPNDAIDITYKGAMIWQQGSFGDNAFTKIRILNSLPTDPSFNNEYSYSLLNDSSQYSLIGVLEGEAIVFNSMQANAITKRTTQAYVSGNYNGLLTKVSTGGIDYVLALPSITSNYETSTDIIDIINNKALIYDGFTNIPSTYKSSDFKLEGNFNYTTSNLVVFSGSLDALSEGYNQVTFLKNFQKAYSGSILSDGDYILKNIGTIDIDTLNPSFKVKLLACDIINHKAKYEVDCDGLGYLETILQEIIENEGIGGTSSIADIIFNISGDRVFSILKDDEGNYWFGTDSGISYYNGSEWIQYNKSNTPELPHNRILGIIQDNNLDYWIGTKKGINKLTKDLSTWTLYNNSQLGLINGSIQSIQLGNNGNIWVGTQNVGFSSFIDGAWSSYVKIYSNSHESVDLNTNKIYSIFEDSDNNIWLSTFNKGIDKMVFIDNAPTYDDVIVNYNKTNTSGKLFYKNRVNYITELKEATSLFASGTLLVGTDEGLSILDPSGIWLDPYKQDFFSSLNTTSNVNHLKYVRYIYQHSVTGDIWLGTQGGVLRIDAISGAWSHYGMNETGTKKLKSRHISSVYEEDNGNIIVLGLFGLDTIDNSFEVNPSNP